MRSFRLILQPLFLSAALTFAASAATAMPAENQSPDNAVSVKAGRAAAKKYCVACHAVEPGKRSKNPLAPTFLAIAAKNRVDQAAGLQIYDGTVLKHPGMPQFELQIYEADGLIAYIRWLARKRKK